MFSRQKSIIQLYFQDVFKAKIDYFTVFSRPKFMDENLVCVFKPKIDYFTVFSKAKVYGRTSRPKGEVAVEPTNWIFWLC